VGKIAGEGGAIKTRTRRSASLPCCCGRARARPYQCRRTPDDQFGSEHFALNATGTTQSFQHQIDGEATHGFHWLSDHGQRGIDVAGPKTVVERYDGKLFRHLDLSFSN